MDNSNKTSPKPIESAWMTHALQISNNAAPAPHPATLVRSPSSGSASSSGKSTPSGATSPVPHNASVGKEQLESALTQVVSAPQTAPSPAVTAPAVNAVPPPQVKSAPMVINQGKHDKKKDKYEGKNFKGNHSQSGYKQSDKQKRDKQKYKDRQGEQPHHTVDIPQEGEDVEYQWASNDAGYGKYKDVLPQGPVHIQRQNVLNLLPEVARASVSNFFVEYDDLHFVGDLKPLRPKKLNA